MSNRTAFTLLSSLLIVSLLTSPLWAAGFEGFGPDDLRESFPAASDGVDANLRVVHAARMNGHPIELDGRLDDLCWKDAEAAGDFRVWDPDRGAMPTEQTIFKVLYDENAIYFGVACLEENPQNISTHLSRRDNYTNSDIVSVYLDPYHDRNTGYNFRVNPDGVLMDSYMFNDGDRDDDWDAVWQAETHSDERGWYAEMKIPFSAIRFRPEESMTWGLQVYRYMHGRGEDTAWVIWDRETRGFISRFGELQGISNVSAPKQLEVIPYFVQRTTDPSIAGPDDKLGEFQNMGADIKYGISANMTLNAAINPDFGQVEADPATLNLSPYETYFQEKRPFFIEGNRFFAHPEFNMFYSRRIGTGNENSRIRFAGKMTGKTAGDISVAALYATTDITDAGKSHNIFKNGRETNHYAVARLGKEYNNGNFRFNLMQTAVNKTAAPLGDDDYATREAYTTGFDFDLNFHNRDWNVSGSYVGSIVDHEGIADDPDINSRQDYGSGATIGVFRGGGKLRGSAYGRVETGDLNLNDMGFLSAPDEISSGMWLGYNYNPDGESNLFNRANFNFNLNSNWLYESRTGYRAGTDEIAWTYGQGHPGFTTSNINGWMQFRNYREAWWGLSYNFEGTQRYMTRGGPLISEPTTWGGWGGVQTDTRKDLNCYAELNYFDDTAGNRSYTFNSALNWNQSSAINHHLDLRYNDRIDDTQYIETVDISERPGGVGIGGRSYVFGDLLQQTLSLTLRTNLLFARNQSLELYVQPYITVGDYRRVRELAKADTYDLTPYEEEGYDVNDFDFSYTAVNLNAVYRWEYRPGSTLFLVWTHSRSGYFERGESSNPHSFSNDLDAGNLFNNEPENVFLAKLTYWFAM
ncbi:MAG: carbohydrate binding family 9 domain-containing protein [Candidatus Eisenbacteria bacterium]|uniref:Carbohydrate binding family 9 domain-containing protein n=1 Tax=Eiseniibacteriota bacterium TaxID=2212470 RepID=A0A948RYP9_UNCEI|nr:carbohydrate binding family 9 domain-containing protein [Candidatus Eisenbacteria bacterium]MBU1950892.1 carbohydrate binding family 9 domain-containing protein [Candidatus Eisenbacteria bacterium]MBU2692856.1 carbohydrate binding family 9 domain-containing protein [Candidatus Eisenbacteria bacterium]